MLTRGNQSLAHSYLPRRFSPTSKSLSQIDLWSSSLRREGLTQVLEHRWESEKQQRIWLLAMVVATILVIFVPQPAVSVEESKPVPASPVPALPSEGDRQKEAEEIRRLQEFYLRNQSVFIRKGEVIVEFNNFYGTDKNQSFIQLSPTSAAIIQTTRRFFDTTIFSRYGLAGQIENRWH